MIAQRRELFGAQQEIVAERDDQARRIRSGIARHPDDRLGELTALVGILAQGEVSLFELVDDQGECVRAGSLSIVR